MPLAAPVPTPRVTRDRSNYLVPVFRNWHWRLKKHRSNILRSPVHICDNMYIIFDDRNQIKPDNVKTDWYITSVKFEICTSCDFRLIFSCNFVIFRNDFLISLLIPQRLNWETMFLRFFSFWKPPQNYWINLSFFCRRFLWIYNLKD